VPPQRSSAPAHAAVDHNGIDVLWQCRPYQEVCGIREASHLKRAGKLTALPEAQVVADARAALEGIRKRANWR
jgi:hypothetical protein